MLVRLPLGTAPGEGTKRQKEIQKCFPHPWGLVGPLSRCLHPFQENDLYFSQEWNPGGKSLPPSPCFPHLFPPTSKSGNLTLATLFSLPFGPVRRPVRNPVRGNLVGKRDHSGGNRGEKWETVVNRGRACYTLVAA